jgi:hypothetical protein
MTLNITDKDKFLSNFLIPISKVADSAVLKIQPGKIESLIATNDNTIIVNAIYNDEEINLTKTLNVPDIKKFCRILTCIEESNISFNVESNNIGYVSSSVRFKYHLYEDNIISLPKINMEKLAKLTFDGEFTLSQAAIASLIRGSAIATETNKLYLTYKDGDLFGDLTDLSRANTDSYGMKLTGDYKGQPFTKPIPLNFEIFRIISCMKFKTINAELITKMGVLVFNTELESSNIKFVVSALEN